jgi:hypothetical protein
MADSNRVQLAYVEEATLGTTPGSPAMRAIRFTGESLAHDIQTTESKEIRSDRQTADLMQVAAANNGAINFELSFPAARTWLADFLRYAMFGSWSEMPEKYNATADSSITAVTNADDTYAVDSGGTAFKAGHLVRTSGFTNAANNALFKVASSTGTTVVMAGTPTLVDESAPPAGARMKVVGFEGGAGDIQANASGLLATALDFTTLGLSPGQWLRVGGAAAGQRFATSANNDWARIVSIAAGAIVLADRPSGWSTDNGSGKTIQVFVGDILRNGTTKKGVTLEKGFLDLAAPEYLAYRGMVVGQMSLQAGSKEVVTGSFTFLGMSHTQSTTPLDASIDAAGAQGPMTASANVGRLAENGTPIAAPNFVKSVSLDLQNNLREIDAVGTLGLVDVGVGKMVLTGKLSSYFGSAALYQKYLAGTETSFNLRLAKDGQAIVITLPRVKFEKGTVVAQGENQDVMAELDFRALRDPTLGCTAQIDRVEEGA